MHLFWHSSDLAVTRFSGKRAPPVRGADAVTREAYTHEVVSFGFWAGDQSIREPTYYAYAAPALPGLREHELRLAEALWAIKERDPSRGCRTPGWDVAGLASTAAP